MTTPQPRRTLAMPRADEPCCCGSGKSFGSCCAIHLPTILDIGKAVAAARRRNDKTAGLVALRADLSLWIILHRTTTRPAMQAGIVGVGPLVEADIENLTDTTLGVAELMELTGEGEDVSAVIEGLRTVVDDPRWSRRITYLQALHLWRTAGLEPARRELAKLGPVGPNETDVRILSLAVTLFHEGRPFAQAIVLYERLFLLSGDLDDRLRALGLKAAAYIEHGDPHQAQAELLKAIALVPDEEEDGLEWDEAVALGWCLTHLCLFRRDPTLVERAEQLFRRELAREGLTPLGQAVWQRALGELFRYADAPERAVEAYREALKHEASFPASVFLAESLLRLGQSDEADQILRALEPARMDVNEYEDYLFVSASAAVQTSDRTAQAVASQRLRAHRATALYFEQRRLAFLVAVEDALKNGKSPGLIARVRALLADPARALNRWIMFEPNIAGIGLRGNSIIDDLVGKAPTKPGG